MSELTSEHFDEVITTFKAHVDDRFDGMDRRLEAVEQLLSVNNRLDKIEVLLAEQFGRDVLIRAGL